ncbi:hypothetical protein ABZW30_19245 [Kitasatospora sp. NPDC004669]|uniref:hypothetical protein n=1 Tax=Kitasatospora sp. NPDC004669 TaxID=3154555 RepID=UPI0033BAEBE3
MQAVEGRGHVGYCEVVVGRRGFWGAGIADEPGRAVAEASRAAVGRVPRGLLAQAGHGRQLDLVGAWVVGEVTEGSAAPRRRPGWMPRTVPARTS